VEADPMNSLSRPPVPVKAAPPAADYTFRLVSDNGLLTLEIIGKGYEKWHRLTPLESGWGLAFRLNATAGFHLAAGAESHEVLLDGRRSSCSCPAGTYRPNVPCRHLAALLALQAEGKLGTPAPAPKPAVSPVVVWEDL
jgi:hypothetical protein